MFYRLDVANISYLISEEASLLHAHDPRHELLSYALSPLNHVLWRDFILRFGGTSGERKDIVSKAYNEYYLALHQAVQSIETREEILVHDDTDSY